jgi:epoxyqueuosine reductase QueG
MRSTGATRADYMIAAGDEGFFKRLSDARRTLPSVRTIIVLGVYAYDDVAAYRNTGSLLQGKIARTYRYYPIVRRAAAGLAGFIRDLGYEAVYGQDVPLKYVAQRIGLGSYGKNSILLNRQFGSYVGLRDVLTDAPLEPDVASAWDPCRECKRCLRACPTGALYAPYKVNPRLCLNPVTRSQTAVRPETRTAMRNWIIGCDICQEVCPVNRRLETRAQHPRAKFEPEHHASHRLLGGVDATPGLVELLTGAYPYVIRRNAAIALGNVGKGRPEVCAALERSLAAADDSLSPYVIWALDSCCGQPRDDRRSGRDQVA